MKNLLAILLVLFLIPVTASDVRADNHIDIPPEIEKLIQENAIKLRDRAKLFGRTARQESQDAMSDDWLEACGVAVDFCSEKVAACNACIDSWTSVFGIRCWDECAEAAGACEAAAKVCEAGS